MKYRLITTICVCALAGGISCRTVSAAEQNDIINNSGKYDAGIVAGPSGSKASGDGMYRGAGVQRLFDRTDIYSNWQHEDYLKLKEALGMTDPLEMTSEEVNEYADFAIADVITCVNVRSGPGTDYDIIGKIYDGAVAHILAIAGEEEDWFQIVSGNVEGYIKAEFFIYGEAAAEVIDDYVTRYAVVVVDRLNVRKDPSIESKRIGYIDRDERVRILENQGDWLQVQYTDSTIGYVAAEYVNVVEEFVYAKTLEEEAKELEAKKALEARSKVSEKQAAENTYVSVNPPATTYSTNEELRSQIVAYAMQYVGNKYVHGGQTLAGGTDCSGFTSLIYAEFGYSLSRTPGGQLSGAGRSISYSDAQPGDIICYGYNGTCTHVAIYLGDGKIIHSANPRKGVVVESATNEPIMGVKNVVD